MHTARPSDAKSCQDLLQRSVNQCHRFPKRDRAGPQLSWLKDVYIYTLHTYICIYIYIHIYIYIYQFTRSPPLAPLAEQPWVARFFFLAIETWDVIASKIGSSKLHSIFTSPIEAPITGCAHRHRQRPQHPFDRTHQMSDIPRDEN